MRVADMEGDELDYWVMKAEGWGDAHLAEAARGNVKDDGRYSSDWGCGGPIIEREGFDDIFVSSREFGTERPFSYTVRTRFPIQAEGHGATILIAAMRCFVASRFGDTVPAKPQPCNGHCTHVTHDAGPYGVIPKPEAVDPGQA